MHATTLILALSSLAVVGPDTVIVSPPDYLDALASVDCLPRGGGTQFCLRFQRGNSSGHPRRDPALQRKRERYATFCL